MVIGLLLQPVQGRRVKGWGSHCLPDRLGGGYDVTGMRKEELNSHICCQSSELSFSGFQIVCVSVSLKLADEGELDL